MAAGFQSKAQHRKFVKLLNEGKITDKIFKDMLKATPDLKDLPEKVIKLESMGDVKMGKELSKGLAGKLKQVK